MSNKLGPDTTIDEVMDCPNCGSDNTYSYSTDEIEFCNDGTGHYYIDCECKDCNQGFRRYIHFKYQITSYS